MAKNYLLQFGSGNPANKAGLAPTFIVFKTTPGGTDATPPGITQLPIATGLYYFTYGPTNSISFVVDGATTGLSSQERYISGLLDPIDAVDEQLTAVNATMISNFVTIGTTLVAIGNSLSVLGGSFVNFGALLGTTGSTFGGISVEPTTIFGYLKRSQEFMEGNSTFTKASGFWNIYSRGSSNLLATKTLADTSTQVTKV